MGVAIRLSSFQMAKPRLRLFTTATSYGPRDNFLEGGQTVSCALSHLSLSTHSLLKHTFGFGRCVDFGCANACTREQEQALGNVCLLFMWQVSEAQTVKLRKWVLMPVTRNFSRHTRIHSQMTFAHLRTRDISIKSGPCFLTSTSCVALCSASQQLPTCPNMLDV